MKTRFQIASLGLALLLTSHVSANAGEARVGDCVAAIWPDGNYYTGTVTKIDGEKVGILYDDGDKLDVPTEKVRVLSKSAQFNVGDHVIAAWKGARMYSGVITAVSDVACTVKWDDGDTPIDVAKSRIVALAK